MSFLYKRLAKLVEIAAKKDIEEKNNFSELPLEELKLEQLKYARTISVEQHKINK